MLQVKGVTNMNDSENQNLSSTKPFKTSKIYPRSVVVLSSFALLLNIFVIVLMLRNKKLRRRPANKFLLNLLLSDAIVCISFISYAGHLLTKWDDKKSFFENYFVLQNSVVFFYVVIVLSMLNFTLITIDRLIAVKWPFFYMNRIHTRESLIAIAVVWGITVAYMIIMVTLFNVLLPQTSRYLGNVTFVAVVIVGFITLFVSNSFVFAEAKRHLRRIEKITYNIENISVELSNKSNSKEEHFRKKEFRLVRINIGLILCFFLFWINVFILFIKLLVYTDEVKKPIHFEYILASWYLVHIYYICNPLWYVVLSYDVKREVKQFFRWKRMAIFSKNSSLT